MNTGPSELDERRKIVYYYLKNNKDFQTAAETFQISYQHVYQWVRNYEVDGEKAELTLEQKIKLEM